MERFSYIKPETVQEAVCHLNEVGTKNLVLAGGTDLMLLIRQDRHMTGRLVDITGVREMREIKRAGDYVIIGAAATFSEVMNSAQVIETAPLLARAASQVGAVQIRNMGTIGGNLANAAACADSIPPLVCLGAAALVATPGGESEIPVADFILSPNKTALPAGGLITAIKYRVPPPGSRSVFIKLGRRNAMAISRLTVATMGHLDRAQTITEARYVTGSATPRICRLDAVEKFLVGKKPTPENLLAAASIAVDEMVRLAGRRWSSEYKIPALTSMTVRALTEVFRTESSRVTP